MIGRYIKEYGFWYGLYLLLFVSCLLSFYLYNLPLYAFLWTILFTLTVLVLLSAWYYWRFSQKMAELHDFDSRHRSLYLNKPSDQAYLSVMSNKEEEARQILLRYKNKEQELQSIAKMWSHQMKVPLSALSLMVQTEQLEPKEVRQQILHLEKYLDTMLTYLKFSGNKDDFRFEVCSVRAIVTDLVKRYRISFLAKELSIDIQGDWQCQSDKKWLSFALSQVLDNAIKYSKQGGHIQVQLDETGVTISDTGIGILAEDLPRLFEEGFTGYNGHEHKKASGLGLYMTKQVLEQLGMTIRIESQVDRGTQVHLSRQENPLKA